MKFYTTIAEHYDRIFPFKPVQKDFIESLGVAGPQATLLDVGCGTGSLIISLSEQFSTSVGIDPDPEMLQMAKIKSLKSKIDYKGEVDDPGKLVFLPKGMLDLTEEFAAESFTMVLCLGNTLVHLSSMDEVKEMLQQCYQVLKPDGRLIFQVINYDRIFEKQMPGLPTIEDDGIRFERVYRYQPDSLHVQFQTRMTDKTTGLIIENEVSLLALRPAELRSQLIQTGFSGLEEYGNFNKDPFTKESEPYIVVAKKIIT